MNTLVYRCYDEAGQVIYVGMTRDYRTRMHYHKSRSLWFGETARIEREEFPTREAASERERALIRELQPRHNSSRYLPNRRPTRPNVKNVALRSELSERLEAFVLAFNAANAPAKVSLTNLMNDALDEYLTRRGYRAAETERAA